MSSDKSVFTKENLDIYLRELAKEYRRLFKKSVGAEIILIGGASVLVNYGFRDMTADVDAIIEATSVFKDAVNAVGDRFGLPNGWLNSDFRRTSSYSPKLSQYSTYYKTFSNILTVRTVSAEYLIAMKLKSGRRFKNDLSDILGILAEHEKKGRPITIEAVRDAYSRLYGNWDELPESTRSFIEDAYNEPSFTDLYEKVIENERNTRGMLIEFDNNYPNVGNESNIDEIIEMLRKRRGT